jgi:hypothetical protein
MTKVTKPLAGAKHIKGKKGNWIKLSKEQIEKDRSNAYQYLF